MKAKINLLLAEDELALGTIVKESLESRNFNVFLCENGNEALEVFLKNDIDVLVLDVMMPKKDGFALAKEIRKINAFVPVLFLTAKSQTQDVVKGFKIGGNDYIKKPFSMEELIVRVEALLNRVQPLKKTIFTIGFYQFNTETQQLIHSKQIFNLTNRESTLLEFLVLKKGEIIERDVILNAIWGNNDFFSGRSMDVFITKLRKKLTLDTSIQIINSRGRGYKIIF